MQAQILSRYKQCSSGNLLSVGRAVDESRRVIVRSQLYEVSEAFATADARMPVLTCHTSIRRVKPMSLVATLLRIPNATRRQLRRESSFTIGKVGHTNNVIQPIVVFVARLDRHPQMQIPIRLRWSTSLQEKVGTIICLQVIPRVGGEDAGLDISDAPIGADVQNLAAKARTGEVAANDGNCLADTTRALSFKDGIEAVDIRGVEEGDAGCSRLWGRWVRMAVGGYGKRRGGK